LGIWTKIFGFWILDSSFNTLTSCLGIIINDIMIIYYYYWNCYLLISSLSFGRILDVLRCEVPANFVEVLNVQFALLIMFFYFVLFAWYISVTCFRLVGKMNSVLWVWSVGEIFCFSISKIKGLCSSFYSLCIWVRMVNTIWNCDSCTWF